jgi:hypothetical protein
LIFLGAGASVPLGIPTMNGFTEKVAEALSKNGRIKYLTLNGCSVIEVEFGTKNCSNLIVSAIQDRHPGGS